MARSGLTLRVMALLACALLCGTFRQASAQTRAADESALRDMSEAWPGNDMNWGIGDPCVAQWTGVTCDLGNTTVLYLILNDQNLKGPLPSVIGNLTNLKTLDLSWNSGLTGTLPPEIGDLSNLQTLNLMYCSFAGTLPKEIGQLHNLGFLSLNNNQFSGTIPAELGNTSLTWLDISSNFFSGNIPVATSTFPLGLDNITTIQHFHLYNNSLSGSLPGQLFTMPNVIHVLVDHNQLRGSLPNVSSFSLSLTIIRVDNNHFTGSIPSVFESSTSLTDLNFANNSFVGPLPNFTAVEYLASLDLSNNNFNPTTIPNWVTSVQNLSTLVLAGTNLIGSVPADIFNIPTIQKLDLRSNNLSGTLTFNNGPTGPQLVEVDLENNQINGFSGQPDSSSNSNLSIALDNNPICSNTLFLPVGCKSHGGTYVHPPVNASCIGVDNCPDSMAYNPYTCKCSYPLTLFIRLVSPSISNLEYETIPLEHDLASPQNLNLQNNQTYINDMYFSSDSRIDFELWVFPLSGVTLPKSLQDNIILRLQHQTFTLLFGPYQLIKRTYSALPHKAGHVSTAAIVGIVVGCIIAFFIIAASVLLAVYYKRRADRAVMNNPFASWGGGNSEFGEAPKLKGARWFSLAELKTYTNNWSDENMIGVGGYGNVYKGVLPTGDLVAIKRAKEGSMQGANEFKNEIELLSRVHHRNLLGLVGFCYEGGEQALVYEFMPNGTLEDHLKGRADVPLSWDWRLEIALASARGLSYLHNHASPPIIHRDIKSANILLNDKLLAKVADFGLSKLAPDEGEKLVYSVNVKGTLGYLDPEYYMTQNLTDKSDVYSFGVVLLELLTARPPIDGGKYVVREFRTALDRGGVDALRPTLLDPVVKDVSGKELDSYLAIALSCVEEEGANRPTIAEIVKRLEELDGSVVGPMKSGMRSMDVEGGGKKVKFADSDDFISETDNAELLANKSPQDTSYRYQKGSDPFQYSGAYTSTTVRPK